LARLGYPEAPEIGSAAPAASINPHSPDDMGILSALATIMV